MAFAEFGKHPEEVFGHRDLDHGVAEKLQALVIKRVIFSLERNTRVSEGLGEQEAVTEFVDNPLLERVHDGTFLSLDHRKAVPRGGAVSIWVSISNMKSD